MIVRLPNKSPFHFRERRKRRAKVPRRSVLLLEIENVIGRSSSLAHHTPSQSTKSLERGNKRRIAPAEREEEELAAGSERRPYCSSAVFVLSVRAARWPYARLRIPSPSSGEEHGSNFSSREILSRISTSQSRRLLARRRSPLCARSSRRSPLSSLAPSRLLPPGSRPLSVPLLPSGPRPERLGVSRRRHTVSLRTSRHYRQQ